MKIYIKRRGYESFYSAEVFVRISAKHNKIATLCNVTEVNRNEFYKAIKNDRFILDDVREGAEIHQIGNGAFFARLEAKQ